MAATGWPRWRWQPGRRPARSTRSPARSWRRRRAGAWSRRLPAMSTRWRDAALPPWWMSGGCRPGRWPGSRRPVSTSPPPVSLEPVLATGDTLEAATATGRAAGINNVHAELLPQDKSALVDRLRRQRGPVAMVGDGINDAPALASANIGVAVADRKS